MNTKPRAKLTTPDVFRPNNGLNIRTAGENTNTQIERLIHAGFSDEEIASKTFPTYDPAKASVYRDKFLAKIAAIRSRSQVENG